MVCQGVLIASVMIHGRRGSVGNAKVMPATYVCCRCLCLWLCSVGLCLLSFALLCFEFIGHEFDSGLDLSEDCFCGFG